MVPRLSETVDCDFVVLGAGMAGLGAASVLGERAVVLERDARPGGLVKTEHRDGYWFDHVLHLLYPPDAETERFLLGLDGAQLGACPPTAWVHTSAGRVRYPLQMHLAELPPADAVRCLTDLARAAFAGSRRAPRHFEELLLGAFGRAMCDLFLLPYNRKMWKRPLTSLAPTGFQWTIPAADFERALRAALDRASGFRPYNANGYYPRPSEPGAPRGMEVLSTALARTARSLRLGHSAREIDLRRRTVTCDVGERTVRVRYRQAICSTLPLPSMARLCRDVTGPWRRRLASLRWNRVLSAMFSIRGARPEGTGHWAYFADEGLCFNRLVYPHSFDAASAPVDGWGLLAEITQPAELPLPPAAAVLRTCRADLERVSAIPPGCRIVDEHLVVADPAYVVFTRRSQRLAAEFQDFLRQHDVEPLGRYGRWEYSSMGQAVRDGRQWALRALEGELACRP